MLPPIFIDHSLYIKDLIEVKLRPHEDERGANLEGFNYHLYKKCKSFKNLHWLVDSSSYSIKNVIRGFHGDSQNYKLIHVTQGMVQFFAVDKRKTSPTYNNHIEFTLTNDTQILLPPKVLNAHACISENCIFTYKLSYNYTSPKNQIHMHWKNNGLNLPWRIKDPILSLRDQ